MFMLCALTYEEQVTKDGKIEELLARMARLDMSAMGELYELIKTDIYAYALSKTAKPTTAEDITHDTFVQLYQSAGKYKAMGKPMAWIITIELNLIRRHFQLNGRVAQLDDSIDIEDRTAYDENTINNVYLREMMHSLTSDEREIITLHVVSGLKHREIAKLLHKPLSTVLSRYNRAIKKLKDKWGEEEQI